MQLCGDRQVSMYNVLLAWTFCGVVLKAQANISVKSIAADLVGPGLTTHPLHVQIWVEPYYSLACFFPIQHSEHGFYIYNGLF